MRFFPPLKAARIDQIQPGTCFAFDFRGTTHIGIAVVPVFAGEAPAFAGEAGALIAVSPGHPDLDGDPGVLLGSVIQHQPILIFPEARVMLPTDLQHIHHIMYLECKTSRQANVRGGPTGWTAQTTDWSQRRDGSTAMKQRGLKTRKNGSALSASRLRVPR